MVPPFSAEALASHGGKTISWHANSLKSSSVYGVSCAAIPGPMPRLAL
jgi:hypothetical protein